MREKLQTLPLSELKELAKSQGMKGISALRKAELIDLLCAQGGTAGEESKGKGKRTSQAETKEAADRTSQAETKEAADRTSQAEIKEAADRSSQRADAGETHGVASGSQTNAVETHTSQQDAGVGQQDAGADQQTAGADQQTAGADQQTAGAGQPTAGAETRNGGRPQMRAERSPYNRTAGSGAQRSDNRRVTMGRSGGRNEGSGRNNSYGNRGDNRSDNRSGNRGDNRMDNRTDNRSGNRNNSRYDNNRNSGNRDNRQAYGTQDRQNTANAYQPATQGQPGQYQPSAQGQAGQYQPSAQSQYGQNQSSAQGQAGQYQPSAQSQYGQNQPSAQGQSGQNQPAAQSQAGQNQSSAQGQPAQYQPAQSSLNPTREFPTTPIPRSDGRGDFTPEDIRSLDSGIEAYGILEVMQDGFGFIRCENFLPGDNDVYVSPSQIRRFNMKTGDMVRGSRRIQAATEKFAALLYVTTINGFPTEVAERRPNFEDLTPIFPNQRLHMETPGVQNTMAMRILDLMAPIGKGQRGMIVSPPKAGKTTLLKQVAAAITNNEPNMHLIILLIDERPEEVTDIKEAIVGPNVEVIYSTFDELPDRHKRVSEMVIERARRLVEHGRDVTILLDSITRLARAYNLVVPPSGRTLSGGLDPAALHAPKRFFGAARNMRQGGSLTILATALIDTGSRMDDVIYEEFKGTGNMELVLDRKLSERRIFPAIDILKSGTRRDDLLLSREEAEAMEIVRRATNSMKPEDSVEKILELFSKTRTNREVVDEIRRRRYI